MRTALARLAGLAALALLLAPHSVPSQEACSDDAARNLFATSYVDALLNPPKGEDTEFFTRSGGVPNVMFVLDTSGSMERLPPNGPAFLGGTAPTMPTGNLLADPASSTDQDTAYEGWENDTTVVGCGLDPVSAAAANVGGNGMLKTLMARQFYSPCGKATDQTLIGATYQGHATDYADQMKVCPRFTSPDPVATGSAGFDPDYYSATTTATTVGGGDPNFFGRDLVFHDSIHDGPTWDTNNLDFKHNFGNGWTDEAVYPAKINNAVATIDSFCDAQGKNGLGNAIMQGALTRASVCKTCLRTAGWYYDGVVLQRTQDGVAAKRYPSIWYTGNYLNFFPPKFLIARKIVKDVIATQSKIRMALARFDDTGALVTKKFNPSCDHPDSNFDSNRSTYVDEVDTYTFGGGTPLAHALFDVGRFYHSPDLPWFGSTWENADKESDENENSYAICYSCQVSSVILLTDGAPSVGDGNGLPDGSATPSATSSLYAGDATTGIRGIAATACPTCDKFSGDDEYKDNLAKVAWYMHNMDLRDNDETTRDCTKNGGRQGLDTYTVGFATGQLTSANTILASAAAAGGGIFIPADNPQTLRDGIFTILEDINGRSTSFSVATVSTLQTTSGRAVIVPRFEPSKSPFWNGHLLRFDLYSEFVNSCIAKSDGTGEGDLDCDGYCTSVFLQDAPTSQSDVPDYVTEDGAGSFVKATSVAPVCAQAPKCKTTTGKSCANVGSQSATPWWDAGEQLAGTTTSQKWKARKVYTVVDDAGPTSGAPDGKIDRHDTVFQLSATDAVADKVIPYLGLGGGVCTTVATKLTTAGDAAGAAKVVAASTATAAEKLTARRECVKTVVRWLLGADVFNSQAKPSGFPKTSQDDLWDRAWLLGDVFHSSPVVVDPPLPRTGVICPNGLSNQCLPSLWATDTEGGKAGYDAYAADALYEKRRKLVLVGANDGLIHAFKGGDWQSGNDLSTNGIDESQPPFNGYYDRGDGTELWAFLSPDLIAKIPMLMGTEHQFFVDGTAMVRDVWVDGSANGIAPTGTTTPDDVKQAREFHTVAVVGERRGGTRFFALDLTDATGGSAPEFLWVYPQPGDPESLEFGETYTDFLPRPPPIGPVRMKVDDASPLTTKSPTFATTGERYHERWVAFLNGGFDPQYLRGRGVHMVDVWTGAELFDFSWSADTTSPRNALRFPVPSVVGMVGWGPLAKRANLETNGYFFDTATFGDAGGQLWVVRFHAPGVIGPSGKVENWWGGRMFQMGTSGQSCKLCAGQPFFYLTANIALPDNGAYRVLAGTGDRFNLLDLNGGTCGPDNIRACVLRGCTVTVDETGNLLASGELGSAARGLSQTACGTLSSTATDGTVTGCGVQGRVKIAITGCPSPLVNNGPDATTKEVQVTCTAGEDGIGCARTVYQPGAKLELSNSSNAISLGNWYYSLLAFEDSGVRGVFDTEPEAKTYDDNRLWLNQTARGTHSSTAGIATISSRSGDAAYTTATTYATADGKGWAMWYDSLATVTADEHTYNVNWMDERTSSVTSTWVDVFWNTMQPAQGEVVNTSGRCDVPKCGAIEARRVATKYGANVTTGERSRRLLDASGNPVRAVRSALLVPTQSDQPTVFVNQKGEIAVGLTAVNPERGATNVGQTDPVDPSLDFGFIEVSEAAHACRHPEGTAEAVCR